MMTNTAQNSQGCYSGNGILEVTNSCLIWLSGKSFGPGNLSDYLRIVKTWILEENQLLLPYYTVIAPNYIINITLYTPG